MNADSHAAGKILIVTASVGAGHNAAARAIAAGLDAAGRRDVDCLDVLEFAPWWFRAYYAGGFALTMSTFPRLYGLGFHLSDRPQTARRGLRERVRLWRERAALGGLRRRLCEMRPDLIVHTHFLAPPVVADLNRRGLLAARQVVVVTDVRVHRFWYAEGIERWFVPAAPAAAALARWGVDAERVTVSGIPIHPKWTAPLDRRKILDEWNLPPDRPVVLIFGGAEFTCGPVVRIARGVAAACPDACAVVLAGRNKKLLARLSALPEAADRRLVGVAFTDRVHELVEVCSLMVTKPGGITTAECLAKATPMVLTDPIPGHEAGNAAYFHEAGAAVIARGADAIVSQVRRLLADQGTLAEMGENARRLYRPATETIAAAVASHA